MVRLKRSDIRALEDAFDMHSGYVLDFSDRTIAEFFEDELRIDFFDQRFAFNGSSKAKRLRALFEVADAFTVCQVARALWQHREAIPRYAEDLEKSGVVRGPLFDLLNRLEEGGAVPRTDAFERFQADETLEELIAAIERDIHANKPAAAMDRLHNCCQKKFKHLLTSRGISCDWTEPLHSRVGKCVKALEGEREIHDITRRILKSSISIFDEFNDIRNHESFAHDNDLVEQAEARFIYDAISAILRFVKTVDAIRFGS